MAGCIFCGRTPTTVEHILGRAWVSSLMPGNESFTTRLTRSEDVGGVPETRRFSRKASAGGATATVNCVCAKCNNGWMQELDQLLQPALTDIVNGETGTLHVLGCRLMAVWATKTALLIDEMWNEPMIPAATKLAFGKTRTLPQGWTYWLAVRSETDDRSHLRATTLGPDPSFDDVEGLAISFRVLHLIVHVLAPINPVVLWHEPAWRPYLQCLWPRLSALSWPPPEDSWIDTDDAAERLENAIRMTKPRPHSATP